MPSLITIIMHLGTLLGVLKDLEQMIADAVAGKASKADMTKVLQDLSGLVSSGLINIPGLSVAQLEAAISDLEKAFLA